MKEQTNIKGIHHAFSLPAEPDPRVFGLIRDYIRKGADFTKLQNLILGYTFKENIVVTVGRTAYAEIMTAGSAASTTGEITDGALGDGASGAFANSDTQLNNEVGRKAASDAAYDDNIAYIDFFFDTTDVPDQTYNEWMTSIDGDGVTANDGTAFSLVNLEIVKSGSVYIASRYTIT